MPDRFRMATALAAVILAGSATTIAPAANASSSGHSGPVSWRTGHWQGHKTIFVTNLGRRPVRVKCTWAAYYSDTFRLRPGHTHKTWAMAPTRSLTCWARR